MNANDQAAVIASERGRLDGKITRKTQRVDGPGRPT